MRAWVNVSLAVLIKRRVSLIIVIGVCCLRQLFMPIDNTISLVSDLGDVCFCKMAVKCLNVAPGKLSIWMSSIFLFGMRAKLESPVIIMFFYRQGPHSGFAVRRGVYSGLVVGSIEHGGREKGRRSQGFRPFWETLPGYNFILCLFYGYNCIYCFNLHFLQAMVLTLFLFS